MKLSVREVQEFQETIWEHYRTAGRYDLPWRLPEVDGSYDLYKIFVSELMLQQTQVARVIPKFQVFLAQFPTAASLAAAKLGDVLRAWQGLGYNRRAKFLWQAVQQLQQSRVAPNTAEELIKLPGVGENTAGALVAYVYNQPSVFVETNIRTAYIYHFTRDGQIVSDNFIRDLVSQTLDHEHPREWYWALMDYGAWLKTQVRNVSQSKTYTKQSAFHGSKRQVRGVIVRLLSAGPMTKKALEKNVVDTRLEAVLDELVSEGLVRHKANTYSL